MPTAAAMESYYDRRSGEYDDWYRGTGLFTERDRPGWDAELATVTDMVLALRPRRTLDVACGTGFVTRHLPGAVIGLDLSRSMLREAGRRLDGPLVNGDALALPFADASFERIFTGHFYGHLDRGRREAFLAEARRVARELVVLGTALRRGVEPDQVQVRVLKDGSTHRVYKRFFTPNQLMAELGGGDVLFAGRWFVLVRSPRRSDLASRRSR